MGDAGVPGPGAACVGLYKARDDARVCTSGERRSSYSWKKTPSFRDAPLYRDRAAWERVETGRGGGGGGPGKPDTNLERKLRQNRPESWIPGPHPSHC